MHKTLHTTLVGICYCVEMVRIENHSNMLEISCYVAILRVLNFFDTFMHEFAQTWFVLHETFGIYYCVEVVWIENYSHMLEITC